MKQTAVEFLLENIEILIKQGQPFNPIFKYYFIEEAKEMEKQQQLELIQFLADREDFKEHSSMSIFIAEDFLNEFKNK